VFRLCSVRAQRGGAFCPVLLPSTSRKRCNNTAIAARREIPAKLPANQIDPEARTAVLRAGRRGLQMVLRLLAHNAEHWLATHLNAYLRDDDEYRAVTRETIIRGLAGVIGYTPTRSPSPSNPPASAASPAPSRCSLTRSTPSRHPSPATIARSPTASPRTGAFNSRNPGHFRRSGARRGAGPRLRRACGHSAAQARHICGHRNVAAAALSQDGHRRADEVGPALTLGSLP
jgi:hypothetical protein